MEDEGLDWRALLEQLREAAHQLSRGSASGCSDDDVKAILHKVLKDAAASKYKVAALKEEVAALREEAAKLKRELALRDTELEQLKEQLKRQLAGNSHCINGREAEPNQRSLDASSYYSPEEEAPEEEAAADKKAEESAAPGADEARADDAAAAADEAAAAAEAAAARAAEPDLDALLASHDEGAPAPAAE